MSTPLWQKGVTPKLSFWVMFKPYSAIGVSLVILTTKEDIWLNLKVLESYFSFLFLMQKSILYDKIAISQKKFFSQIQF